MTALKRWIEDMIIRSTKLHHGEYQRGYNDAMRAVLKNLEEM